MSDVNAHVKLTLTTFLLVGSSSFESYSPGFVPPLVALLALANWEVKHNQPFLFAALDFLVKENTGIRRVM